MRKQCKRVKRLKGHILIESQVAKIVTQLHIAAELIPLGLFNKAHANAMANAVNIVFVDADGRNPDAYQAAKEAGDVIMSMHARVKEGKNWGATVDERAKLIKAIVRIDKHIRTMTTSRLSIAAVTVDTINKEAKEKGYGFLDQAPVVKA